MEETDTTDIHDLGQASIETCGPVGPIDEFIVNGPIPGLQTE